MSRIAILGSCITRDLWPIRGGGAERLLYVCRTSFPSLLSQPVRGFAPDDRLPGDLHQHEHNALIADLRKTALTRLLAFRPTHVIFDFIDDRFDLLAVGDSIATRSGELIRSGYLLRPELRAHRTIPRLSSACERLWISAAAEFSELVRSTPLADAQLILHSARWASDHRDREGRIAPIRNVEILGGDPVDIADYNALLERQEAAFMALMPAMTVIDASAFRLAETEHRWGLSPFHYVPEYYDEVRRQLADAGLDDAFTAPDAWPSAPAA
ncbi:DUF6270 domain-containing protein [Phenylobacterium kunshanense]|uniref:Uncharacterized protein n=1 Tax=Phenylobacterium kunshanense TaxID=1445034 RepID=A0A328BB93_9CAUL|nr:DUF6270 domain-containing protein [Phenylobacterium kunshanense]RAK64750.1 hypothetical protein DJ019_12005 [Phenylobacterium kunshanense]